MKIINVDGHIINLDYLVDAQANADGSYTLFMAVPQSIAGEGSIGPRMITLDGPEAVAVREYLDGLSAVIEVNPPPSNPPPSNPNRQNFIPASLILIPSARDLIRALDGPPDVPIVDVQRYQSSLLEPTAITYAKLGGTDERARVALMRADAAGQQASRMLNDLVALQKQALPPAPETAAQYRQMLDDRQVLKDQLLNHVIPPLEEYDRIILPG